MIPLLSPKEANLPTALALGSFDGLHAGHRKVIDAISKNNQGVFPTVVSFWPHPREVLYGETRLRLDLPSEKTHLLEPLGIKQLVLIPFDKDLAKLSPEEFVQKILIQTLKAKRIAVGENFRFGKNRTGNVLSLKKLGADAGVDVIIIPILKDKNGRISSSRIRQALSEGNLLEASKLLGRSYTFRGIVEKGKGIGTKIGWPTANLKIDGRKFLPGLGVYASWAWRRNHHLPYKSVMNLGPQPTIDPTASSAVEVHLIDCDDDLLGEQLTIEPIKRLRGQSKFKSLDELSKQISLDKVKAISILKEN